MRSSGVVLLHAGGAWDELLIAVIAFGVLFVAVKLAGRKPVGEEEEQEAASVADSAEPHADTMAVEEPRVKPSVRLQGPTRRT